MGLTAISANGMEKQHPGSGYESLPSRKRSNYFSKNRQFIYCIYTVHNSLPQWCWQETTEIFDLLLQSKLHCKIERF